MAGPVIVDAVVTGQTDGSEDRIASEFEQALERAFSRAAKQISSDFRKIFAGGGGATKVSREFAAAARNMSESLGGVTKQARTLDAEIKKIAGSLKNGTFAKGSGTDVYAAEMAKASALTRELREQRDAISKDEGLARAFRQEGTAVRTSLQGITKQLTSLAREQDRISQRGADAVLQSQRDLTSAARREASERIAIAQIEGSRSTAEFRAAAQRRITIMQAAISQIRGLERGLSSIFEGTARAIGSSLSGIASRLSSSNRQFTAGTAGAVNQRTSIIQRAFSRQTQIINTQVQQQSAALQRLDRQLSTGIAGAATGRSGVANALGIGGGIVAGAGIARVLRDGLTAGADFTQGLAVLDAQLQLTDAQLASVRQTSLDLGNDIKLPGVSALDAAQAIGLLSKQFSNLGENAAPTAEAAARGVLALSRATGSSAEDAAQIVGAAINVFGIGADQAVSVADKVATALSNAAGTSSTEFAQAFKQGASVFDQFQSGALGADGALDQFNAALSILARNGIVGSDAGTSLRSFFLQGTRQAAEATSASKELAKQAGVTGNVFYDEQGNARALSESIDILRVATKDMSEEQRNAALGILFGTDAIRSANALIATTDEEYDKVVAAMRRQGTAAELAAAQNQGLRGAMDALGSTIETQLILAYEKVNVAAGNVVLVFANLFNNLASGEGIFAAIRTGLKGVAIGLGALLGVKAVAEGFGLLRVALAGLLTPVGATIAAFALAGGGIALLLERSEGARAVFEEVKDGFTGMVNAFKSNDPDVTSTGFAGVMERLGVKARELFNFIGDELIPRIKEIGTTIADNVLGVVRGSGRDDELVSAMFGIDSRNIGEKIGDKIRELVGPVTRGIQTGIGFIRDVIRGGGQDDLVTSAMFGRDTRTVGEKIGDRIRDIFDDAQEAIGRFWNTARTALEPATRLIGNLAGALKDLAAANPARFFTTLGAGLAGALGGFALGGPVGAVIGGLGGGLGALFAQGFGDEVVGGLQSLGSTILGGVRSVAGTVGRALASVFSPDNLIDAGLFATGLAQSLGRILGNVLSDPRLVAGAAGLAGIAALAAGRFILGFGQGVLSNVPELASLIGDGLEAALNAAFDVTGLGFIDVPVDWLAKALLPAAAIAALVAAFRKVSTVANRALVDSVSGAAVSGGSTGPRSFIDGLIGGQGGIERAAKSAAQRTSIAYRNEFARANRVLTAAGRSPLDEVVSESTNLRNARQAISELNDELGTSRVQGRFAADAIGRIGDGLRNLDLRTAVTGLRDLGNVLKTNGRDIGLGVGAAVGTGIAAGMSAQLATSGGAGNAVMGLLGIAGSVGTAFAIGGPGLAAAAAGIGAVTFAISKSGEAAAKAEAKVKDYVDALRGVKPADFGGVVGDRTLGALASQGEDVLRILTQAGFNATEFGDRLVSGTSNGWKEQQRLLETLGLTNTELYQASLRTRVTNLNQGNIADKARGEVEALGFEYEALVDTLILLGDEGGTAIEAIRTDALLRQLDATKTAADGLPPSFIAAANAFKILNDAETFRLALETDEAAAAADRAKQAFDEATSAVDDFFGVDTSGFTSAVDDFLIGLPGLGAQLAENLTLPPGAVADAVARSFSDDIEVDLKGAIRVGLEDGSITASPEGIRAALDGIAQQVSDAAANGQITPDVAAAVNLQIAEIKNSGDLPGLISDLLTAGVIPTTAVDVPLDPKFTFPEDLGSRLGNDIAATMSVLAGGSGGGAFGFARAGDSGGGQSVDVPIEINPQITLAGGASAAAQAVGASLPRFVAQGVASAASGIAVAIAGAVRVGVFAAALVATTASGAGLTMATSFAAGIRSGTGAAVGAARALGAQASAAVRTSTGAAFSAGQNVAQGLAAGIRSGAGAAIGAARAMAAAVTSVVRSALKISSPSRVFADIGRDIGRGLAQGIADSDGDITNAARNAVDAVVNSATSRADQIASASSSLVGLLRPSGANGVSAADRTRTEASLATLSTDLRGVFDKAATDLWNAVAETGQGEGDAIQRGINHQFAVQGIGFQTLDAQSILGSGNVSGFLDVAERISEFIEQSLAAGDDVGLVTSRAEGYADQLREVAAGYGANASEVEALLGSLGLTDSALAQLRGEVDRLKAEAAQNVAPTPDPDADKEAIEAKSEADREARERQDKILELQMELLRIAVGKPTSIELTVPYGDPEAIALATVNRIADSLSI